MATKADLIAEVVAKSWKGFYILDSKGVVTGDDGKTISEYIVNYAELVGGTMTKRNLGFYVYQEGEVDEDAEWRDVPKKQDTARDAVQTFLEGLTNVVRARIDQLDEEELYGFATIWRTIDATTAKEAKVFVWTDDGQTISARELV
jgi:hypothetical protein